MKKKFQTALILFLAYTFISCPLFTGFAIAGNTGDHGFPPNPILHSLKLTLSYINENLAGWIDDYTFPTSISDVIANKEKRDQIKKGIKDVWFIVYSNKPQSQPKE